MPEHLHNSDAHTDTDWETIVVVISGGVFEVAKQTRAAWVDKSKQRLRLHTDLGNQKGELERDRSTVVSESQPETLDKSPTHPQYSNIPLEHRKSAA